MVIKIDLGNYSINKLRMEEIQRQVCKELDIPNCKISELNEEVLEPKDCSATGFA